MTPGLLTKPPDRPAGWRMPSERPPCPTV